MNHHTSDLSTREMFQIAKEELIQCNEFYRETANAEESLILVTCNRIEFYQVDRTKKDLREGLHRFYKNRSGYNAGRLDASLFFRQGTSVSRHLFRVASGMDSALIGEYQVLGQVKQAYSTACSVNTPGRFLHKLFHYAFQISKRIRRETELGKGPQGLAGASLDILTDVLNLELKAKKAVVIGVNSSTEMALKRFQREGVEAIVLNRTTNKAEKLANLFGFKSAPFENRRELIGDADIVFSSTAASDFVLDLDDFAAVPEDRKITVIDLAIPRDVDPAVRQRRNLTLLDLDSMKMYLDRLNRERSLDLPFASEMIEEQVALYENWWRSSFSSNHAELRAILENDRLQIVKRFEDNFRAGDHKALKAFSKSLMKQFIRRISKQ